jgi:hypothetical protein
MDKHELFKKVAASEEAPTPWHQSENTLGVVSVYEDPVTRDWASELWGRVTQLIGKEGIRFNAWKISELSQPAVFEPAVAQAAAADVLLISLRATDELPPTLYAWAEGWLARRTLSAGALVALIGISEESARHSSQAQQYLRGIAARGRMDFLPRERKLSSEPTSAPSGDWLSERANAMTPLMAEILTQGRDVYRHWGINE